jgi:hypothetical protein
MDPILGGAGNVALVVVIVPTWRGEWPCSTASLRGEAACAKYGPPRETCRHIEAFGQAIEEASRTSSGAC